MNPHNVIPDEAIQKAKKMRAEGMTWTAIGRELGYHFTSIRRRVLPGEREKHNRMQRNRYARDLEKMDRKPRQPAEPRIYGPVNHIVVSDCNSRRMAAKLAEEIPDDTRDLTARIMGDPLPGRSALDMRQS